ncbi:MAG: 16S rRNA (guanine(527)-N(7))-methyltransferase RsmG [Tissierellia bacterium]|nr:16S rRNA (guanine(527)-N(7))-methyltransferase RsmG [Tissierellia bacterium]
MNWQVLERGLRDLGLEEDIPQEDLEKYISLLLDWNQKINLTRITDPEDIQIKHILDSLSLLPLPYFDQPLRVLDMGTGAGFPGIPLKLWRPQLNITLMDSLNKRIRFLDLVIEELGLRDIRALHGRAEEAGRDRDHREKYDMVVSRAVARLSTLLEYCLPFVKVGGLFVAMKAEEVDQELAEAKQGIKILGGDLVGQKDFKLPDGSQRSLVLIKKIKATDKKYPRAGGKPRSKPL